MPCSRIVRAAARICPPGHHVIDENGPADAKRREEPQLGLQTGGVSRPPRARRTAATLNHLVNHGFFKKGEIAEVCALHLGASGEMTTREFAERVMVERAS